jgi:hypothetical protein
MPLKVVLKEMLENDIEKESKEKDEKRQQRGGKKTEIRLLYLSDIFQIVLSIAFFLTYLII